MTGPISEFERRQRNEAALRRRYRLLGCLVFTVSVIGTCVLAYALIMLMLTVLA